MKIGDIVCWRSNKRICGILTRFGGDYCYVIWFDEPSTLPMRVYHTDVKEINNEV